MLVTLVITFVFDTGIGLALGIGVSVLFYLGDLAFASITAPVAFYADHGTGIEEVILQGDLTFIQCSRFQNFMDALYRTDPGILIISYSTLWLSFTSSLITHLLTHHNFSQNSHSYIFSPYTHLCLQPSRVRKLTHPRRHFSTVPKHLIWCFVHV